MITGLTIKSLQVQHPVAVRYAWKMNPQGCNLYNKAGLPASPFCTDSRSVMNDDKDQL